MFKYTHVIYIFIFAVLISGCASGHKVKVPTSGSGKVKDFNLMKEDFDPVALKDDDIEIKQPEVSQSEDSDELSPTSNVNRDSVGIGYRIQKSE